MKKIIFMLLLVAGFGLASCEKDEIGGTATQEMSGEWYVTIEANDFWFDQNYYAYQAESGYSKYTKTVSNTTNEYNRLLSAPTDSINSYCAKVFNLSDTTNFDFDKSGAIDGTDFIIGFIKYSAKIEEDDYDLNGDGTIDLTDACVAFYSVYSKCDYDYFDWDEDGEMTLSDWISAYLYWTFGAYYDEYGLELDMDGDGSVTTDDVKYFIVFMYDADEFYSPDANGDGVVDLTDLTSDEYAEHWYDVYEAGHVLLYTSNTVANIATEMLISDPINENSFKVVVDPVAKTFSCNNVTSSDGKYAATLLDGKILSGAGLSPSGMPVDSINFYVKFDNDYADDIFYKISGVRRTGFDVDEY